MIVCFLPVVISSITRVSCSNRSCFSSKSAVIMAYSKHSTTALSCRLLLVGKHKVHLTAWVHWTSVWPHPARKPAVLSAFLLCPIWVFQNDWHSCCLYLWGESCRSRENLVRLGLSKGSLDSSWNLLQKAYALQGKSQLFKSAEFWMDFPCLLHSGFFVIRGSILSKLYLQSRRHFPRHCSWE